MQAPRLEKPTRKTIPWHNNIYGFESGSAREMRQDQCARAYRGIRTRHIYTLHDTRELTWTTPRIYSLQP